MSVEVSVPGAETSPDSHSLTNVTQRIPAGQANTAYTTQRAQTFQ